MQRKTKFVGAQLARQTASPNAETPLLTPPLSAVSLLDGAEEAMSRQESSSLKGRMSTSPSTEFAKINKAVVIQSSSQDGKVEKSVEETEHDGLSTVSEKCVLSSFSDYNQYKKEMLAEPKKNINLYTTSLERMPSWYADNEFVFTGYRRITNSYKGCFLSLFYVHNETANVYSHFAGAIGFLLSGAAFYSAWTRAVAWDDIAAVGAFFFGTISCMVLSTTYHLCCCHSRKISLFWNKADYVGIVFQIFGSFVPAAYYGFYCNPAIRTTYIAMISSFSLATIFLTVSAKFSTPQYRILRAMIFSALGLSGILPLGHSIALYGVPLARFAFGVDRILIMAGFYLGGAYLYVSRVPERWFPGKFDIWGHSHQLFHCLVLIGAIIHYFTIMYIQNFWHTSNQTCQLTPTQMLANLTY